MHFWRACGNYFPTIVDLPSHVVDVDPQYPVCGLALESTLHLYWECPFACFVRRLLNMNLSQFRLLTGEWNVSNWHLGLIESSA